MNRLVLSAALAALLLAPVSAPAASAVPPIAFTARTLANGLKVYSAVDRTTSNVAVQVFYGVGSKDDPQGRSGFAHLFEHMMFKGARDMPPEFMDRLTEDVGGENNASTWDDFTEFNEVIPANHLRRLLWAEAERMGALVVDEANFASERQVVEEELRQRVLADPYGRLFALALPKASFAVHPYRRPGIGSIEDLDAASLKDVQAFHGTYYRPDDAALIVVGNFDPKDLDRWVDQYFGSLKPPAFPIPRVTAVEPARTGPGTFHAFGPNVPLPALAITWLGPASRAPDAPAFEVAEAILGTGDSARLNLDLVHDQQLAAQVFAEADLKQQPGLFAVGAVMAGGRTLAEGETALRAEAARLRDQPVSAEELDRAKTQLIAQALRDRQTVHGKAAAIGFAVALDGDASRANDNISRLQAVTAADIQRVARLYLADDRRMVIDYQTQTPGGDARETTGASPAVAASPLPGADTPLATLAPEAQRQSPPPPGPPVAARLPAPVERTLPNGLRVIVAHSSDLPLVTAQLTVKSGAAGDPAGEAGLAEITASLLNKGAGGRSTAEVARAVEALGGTLDAGAGWDGAQATLSVMADKLQAALPILADVVRRPALTGDELERLRKQTTDDLSVELQDPAELARYAAAVALFGASPYGHVLEGTPQSLQRITLKDVQALHAAAYRPDNAILVLTGDIDPEQGFAMAARAFGDWAAPPGPPPALAVAAPDARRRVVVIDLPDAGQASVRVALPGLKRSDATFYPGIVANGVLGGGYSARLNAEVRVKRGLSYDAGSQLDARRLVGPFVAQASTRNDAAPQVVDLLLQELSRLASAPAGADEIAARKATLTGEYGRGLETASGLARVLSTYALQDVPIAEIGRYDSAVQAVTPQAAQAFAAAALDPSRADIIVAGDARQFLPALKAKFPDLELIPAAELDLNSPSLKKTGG